MLEARRQIANGAGDLRVDGVPGAAGGSRVVRLVEDQQGAGTEIVEPVAQRRGVAFVDEQPVRNQEAGDGRPRVDAVAALLPDALDVIAVEDLEDQAEALFQFVLPLQEHGGRTGDDDFLHATPEQQLAGDQSGFDGLAEAHVVRDEEIHARQQKRLAQRLELVGVDADAGAKGRLEELGIGRGDAVPAERVEVGGKMSGLVEPALSDGLPRFAVEDLPVEFELPNDLECLALGVVVEASQAQ